MTFQKNPSSSPDEDAMKTIVYRGGVVTFRIPAHWREEYSDFDGGTFYVDQPDSGTLRLKIITMSTPEQPQSGFAIEMLQVIADRLKDEGVETTTQARQDGNAVLKYEEEGFEDGAWGTIFYWVIVNPLPPRHARSATFSYAILEKQRNHPQIKQDLEMLEAEIEAATFWPTLGA
jgi:hypothetical protein